MITVGVIITNYNHGDYLRQAVDSVLAQTRRPERLVVIDDGSTDCSADVLDRLPPHVDVVCQENQGVVSARNRGLDMLDTTHVTFLDADDYLLPNFLRWTAMAWALPHGRNLAVVYCPCRNITADGDHGYFHSRLWDPAGIRRKNYIANVSLFARFALVELGGYSETFAQIGHEDWDLLLRLAERGWTGRMLPAPLFCYRQLHGGRNPVSVEQRQSEVDAAIDAAHPKSGFESPPAWLQLTGKAMNLAQTALRRHDARTWLRVPPSN